MKVVDLFIEKAKKVDKTVVLPEGEEPRVIKAAEEIIEKNISKVVILGNSETIEAKAKELGVNLEGVKVVDPAQSEKLDHYASEFYELRKHKGVTLEKAKEIVKDVIYFGTMMVQCGDAHGLVAGSVHSTGDTIKPALQIIKTKPGVKTVSAYFIMEVPDCSYGADGVFIFADSGLNPEPNANQLADIALTSAKTLKNLCGIDPKVAMLSFSTRGSADHPLLDKVKEATEIAKKLDPSIELDGELQVDAAIVPHIGEQKAPGSNVAGKANVLIFPDLNTGNIAYKLVERLAKANAYGPLLQGVNKPVNDLSRGCSVDDIVTVAAITVVQSMDNE